MVAILNDHQDYNVYITKYFSVVLVKFICSSALHLWLYPHVSRSMDWMKYINNHPDLFDKQFIPLLVAFNQIMINIAAEILNLYMLLY